MYLSILNQLIAINRQIANSIRLTDDQINEKYSLGAIAVKNFDSEKELYGRKLEDAFGALFEYWDLPD